MAVPTKVKYITFVTRLSLSGLLFNLSATVALCNSRTVFVAQKFLENRFLQVKTAWAYSIIYKKL